MSAWGREAPSKSMQVRRVAPDWPAPSLMHGRRAVPDRITYVGLDVHKDAIVVAVGGGGIRGGARGYGRIADNAAAFGRLIRKLRGGGGGVRLWFEAGAGGRWLPQPPV